MGGLLAHYHGYWVFISDGGSDSSVSDGPPVHLAAADVKSSKKKVWKTFIRNT